MKHRFRLFVLAAAALVLLVTAVGGGAMTLGRVHGAALIGQALELQVPLQLEAGEDASTVCLDAEVFHADVRQEPSRVRVSVENAAQPQTARVRIRSSSVVDEPIVTVYLRVGCLQKTTRRYVLLADLPSEVAPPDLPAAPAGIPPSPAVVRPTVPEGMAPVSEGVPAGLTQAVPGLVKSAAQEASLAGRKRAPQAVAPVQTKVPKVDKMPHRSGAKAHLRLDPLDLLSDRIADLDAPLNFAPNEDSIKNLQRTQALEDEVKTLRLAGKKNEASLADLRDRLQIAQSQIYPVSLLYGLSALILACAVAIALLWQRQQRLQARAGAWWNEAEDRASPAMRDDETDAAHGVMAHAREGEPGKDPASELGPISIAPGPLTQFLDDPGPPTAPGVSVTEMSDSSFDDLMASSAARAGRRTTRRSGAQREVSARLNSEAELDLRQQADFFVSLGQTNRAVRILKKEIDDSAQPSPLVYLDLFSLFHSLGSKVEFQALREDFNRLFNGRIPEFAFFREEGKSLESYPAILARITARWPEPEVLALLDSYIYQTPTSGKTLSIDLAAFRDLLLLRIVAQSLDPGPASTPAGTQPVAELDLDLSELDSDGSAPAVPDLELPVIPEAPLDAAPAAAASVVAPAGGKNMLDFELPRA